MSSPLTGEQWRVTGRVQGVGFRPYVWQRATELGVSGRVWNEGDDLCVEAWAAPPVLAQLRDQVHHRPPPGACIDAFAITSLAANTHQPGSTLNATTPTPASSEPAFTIAPSQSGQVRSLAPDDSAMCSQCLNELNDPNNRRYRHPFIHCVDCGPRYSLIHQLPFDRAHTTMAGFDRCADCEQEFRDPANRRFHAQTISCPNCGPHYWLESKSVKSQTVKHPVSRKQSRGETQDLVAEMVRLLTAGKILAIKGTGGFRLACRADCDQAVARLRDFKHRPDKPFVVMALNVEQVREFARVSPTEEACLRAPQNPIVLLHKRQPNHLSESVAPGQSDWGVILPGTGLEYLLLQAMAVPLVMTSGNVSGEPLWTRNRQVRPWLDQGLDAAVLHNRAIHRGVDDSLVAAGDCSLTLRRARGLSAPTIKLQNEWASVPSVLAMGGQLKNTFCLLHQGHALVSPHIGDLHNADTLSWYRQMLADHLNTLGIKPDVIAVDRHPDYASSRIGQELAQEYGIPVTEVGHHHAHAVSVMAENAVPLDESVIALTFDGLGLGDDNQWWGGEALVVGYQQCTRFGNLQPAPLPGGERASREPWRNLLAQCCQYDLPLDHPAIQSVLTHVGVTASTADQLITIIQKGINSPPSSSVGRLFDAVAAALCLCPGSLSFEGQAAMALEALAWQTTATTIATYPWALESKRDGYQWNLAGFWRAVLDDIACRQNRAVIAAKFHRTLAAAAVDMLKKCREQHGIRRVVLAGGVLQNRLLSKLLTSELLAEDFSVLRTGQLPVNDGGLSLGQAAIAAAQWMKIP